MTVTESRGFGRQGGHTEVYRGAEYQIEFVPKIKIEVLTDDEAVDRLVQNIIRPAPTRKDGAGNDSIPPGRAGFRTPQRESRARGPQRFRTSGCPGPAA